MKERMAKRRMRRRKKMQVSLKRGKKQKITTLLSGE